jgi:hypothetical protein
MRKQTSRAGVRDARATYRRVKREAEKEDGRVVLSNRFPSRPSRRSRNLSSGS